MDLDIQYVNDKDGKIKAVQIPIDEWKWLQSQFHRLSQELKLKKDMMQAFSEVALMQEGTLPKKTLQEFLREI